jgi:Fe-coproporphyrin III synthase
MAASATLMLHTTGRCNLECQHCYMDGSPRRRERLSFEWMADAIRSAPSLGIGSIYITGGEPMLYDRFDELVGCAVATDGLTITVSTNATMVDEAGAAQLADGGCQVHVSIDGTPAFHDDFRAHRGAFARAARGVDLLIAAGVPVTIVTTVSKRNLEQFSTIAQWAIDHGATRLLVQPLLRLGRGTEIASDRLSTEDLNTLVLQTSDLANRPDRTIRATMVGLAKQFLLAHPCAAYVCNGGGCHRGVEAEIKKIVVREDGTILPEATNLDHRYAIGHVNDGPLAGQIDQYFAADMAAMRGHQTYAAFDRLCRNTYETHVPGWPDAIVPWDQLLADASRTSLDQFGDLSVNPACAVVDLADRLAAAVGVP